MLVAGPGLDGWPGRQESSLPPPPGMGGACVVFLPLSPDTWCSPLTLFLPLFHLPSGRWASTTFIASSQPLARLCREARSPTHATSLPCRHPLHHGVPPRLVVLLHWPPSTACSHLFLPPFSRPLLSCFLGVGPPWPLVGPLNGPPPRSTAQPLNRTIAQSLNRSISLLLLSPCRY